MKKILFALAVFLSFEGFCQVADSTYVHGVVAACHDGETFKIRFQNDTIWCRLAFVDAPEVNSNRICKAQDMGREIGDMVRAELKGKTVLVKFLHTDIYNRPVIRLSYQGQDYSTKLVVNGHAWVVRSKYISKEEYKILAAYKKMAKQNRLGLFVNTKAITPALFRKRNRCK